MYQLIHFCIKVYLFSFYSKTKNAIDTDILQSLVAHWDFVFIGNVLFSPCTQPPSPHRASTHTHIRIAALARLALASLFIIIIIIHPSWSCFLLFSFLFLFLFLFLLLDRLLFAINQRLAAQQNNNLNSFSLFFLCSCEKYSPAQQWRP